MIARSDRDEKHARLVLSGGMWSRTFVPVETPRVTEHGRRGYAHVTGVRKNDKSIISYRIWIKF